MSKPIKYTMKPTAAELRKKLSKVKAKVRKMNSAMSKASIFLDSWVQRNFKTEGGNVGDWKELSAGGRYNSKGVFDSTAKILQDTGRLRASFLPFATRSNAGIGSDLPYAKDHDEGIGVEQRRILPEDSEVMKPIRLILRKHVEDAIKKF